MDAQHHATIVDKLMQYRGKIPKHIKHVTTSRQRDAAYELKKAIDNLMWEIDCYAEEQRKGMI